MNKKEVDLTTILIKVIMKPMSKPKPKIYIETTIPNFFFDFKNQSTEKKIDTVFFWNNNLFNFEPVTSMATFRELEATPNKEYKKILLDFLKNIKLIEINSAVVYLAEQYVKDKLIPQKFSADAVHLAGATVHQIDYLLTWNIQHLAHPFKRKQLRDYNLSKNLFVAEIVTPKELNYQIDST